MSRLMNKKNGIRILVLLSLPNIPSDVKATRSVLISTELGGN